VTQTLLRQCSDLRGPGTTSQSLSVPLDSRWPRAKWQGGIALVWKAAQYQSRQCTPR
jgi:hypothetical protein